jgi:D-3-phosphoglycerate dehydrogenase / 2-oxoglutarate reductase
MIILANDGIDASGKEALMAQGHQVLTDAIPQSELIQFINEKQVEGLLVRSATQVRKDIIDSCPAIKWVGRGGVGIDNIDATYAKEKGVVVFNTPAASSLSVAELVMSMLFAAARYTYTAGGSMPVNGAEEFATLKKKFSKGIELKGKTLAIVGFGRIGRALAGYALGCGMKVVAVDRSGESNAEVDWEIHGFGKVKIPVPIVGLDEALVQSDFISLHVPKQPNGEAVIGAKEMGLMKKTAWLVNTSRGGVIQEADLLVALNNNQIAGACLDVFVGEPKPNLALLSHPKIIATPHIGASTAEAQERIGLEIAEIVGQLAAR